MEKRVNTTRNRLIEYTVWLIGGALTICMMTMFFSLNYNYQYQEKFQQLSAFSRYQEQLDECMANLDLYTSSEESAYLEKAQEDYQEAMEAIEEVSGLIGSPRIFFEVDNLISMTEYLGTQIEEIRQQMEQYLLAGKQDFSSVQAAYNKAEAVRYAIMEDYQLANKLILNDAESIHKKMKQKDTLFAGCMIVFLTGIIIILVWEIRSLSRTITLPITLLTAEAEKIKNRAFDEIREVVVSQKENDEISVLIDVFNDMSVKLQEHIATMEENAKVRQELAESKFKELQSQINPHFLFNTLNMIAETAYFENADKTAELLKRTGKMLRFSLDFSGKTVTLFRELEALDNYIIVQEQRFGERIRFAFELDERFHGIPIPALTLQPLVENAIVHGIGMKASGAVISIRTSYNEQSSEGTICVEDNGVGMSQDRLEEVLQEMLNPTLPHVKIGLSNVYLRLRMLYGQQFHMNICSEKDKGTKIEIRLPCEGEGSYVQADDCR